MEMHNYKTIDELFAEEKLKIAAIEQKDNSVSIEKIKDTKAFDTIMFGNEVDGIPCEIVDLCNNQ